MEEKEIIRKAIAGDYRAFEMIVEKYKDYIFKISYSMVNDYHFAEDISQESFIKIYRSLSSFDFRSSFSTWIYRITYNTALDEIRKQKKEKAVSIQDVQIEDLREDSASPEEEVIEKDERSAVEKAISSLPDDHKILINLFYRRGMSLAEISNITGLNIGTVKSRLNRAKEKLKKILES